ncbi:unnamed protein product [Larinioides sclopetarius]|uniref:Uncharacterized protein n=1 Tax=Larinioides sclopetarius TaxID=280406 RepID=A0AAV2A8N8_9ARAC
MYVDDWITGQDTQEEALLISRNAKNIMKEARMVMRKWISNDSALMNQWKAEGLDSSTEEENDTVEIHAFCDASKLAYGASVYVKVKKQDKVIINLVTSKTRVAPLKSATLPRLQLLGALIAARLSSKVQEIISQKKHFTLFHWTDSKIVFYWIKGSPKRWEQFVGGFISSFNDSQRGWMPMCGVHSKSSTYGVPQSICCYPDGNVLNIRILNVWMKKRMLEYCASLK